MGFQFGNKSKEKLATSHPDLQKIFLLAISRSRVDFGISEGHRSVEKQQAYYAIGRTTELHRKPITNVDGVTQLGKHNYQPSLACDIFIWHNNKAIREKIAWDHVHMAYIAGLLDSCARELLGEGKISHLIKWGANWDMDGIIDYDQKFDDFPHFELVKP